MRLGEIATLELVKLYMQHECLWDPSHKYYRNKGKRTEAYKSITIQLEKVANVKLDDNEVKTKICHLRSTYAQEIKKIINRSTDPNNIYKPNVPWFSVMDDCLKNLKCIKTAGDEQNLLENNDTLPDYWPDVADVPLEHNSDSNNANNGDPLNDDSGELSDVKLSEIKVGLEKENHRNGRSKRKRSSSRHKDRKKSKHKTDKSHNIMDFVGQFSGSSAHVEDEYDLYGRYIAAQLRKISPNRAISVQFEMHRILSEARLKDVTKYEE